MFAKFFSKKPKVEDLVARLMVRTADSGAPALTLEGPNALVTRPLCGPLMISYAFDMGDAFHGVLKSDQTRLGMSDDQLHEIALLGVEYRALSQIKIHRAADYSALTCGGEFEATLLLIEPVWEKASGELNDEVVAFAPRKDLLFFTGKTNAAGIADLSALRERITANGDLKLSADLLLHTRTGWEPFR